MSRVVYRSSITGRYVSKRYAEANPDTTEREAAGVLHALVARLRGALRRKP